MHNERNSVGKCKALAGKREQTMSARNSSLSTTCLPLYDDATTDQNLHSLPRSLAEK